MDRESLIGLNHFKEKDGILIIEAQTAQKANEVASEILQKYSDLKSALFLSGGKTPTHLFKAIAVKKCIKAGAVGMVDERFGERLHKNSNELMIKNSGLIDYLESLNIRFYPMLEDKEIEETAKDYDEALRFIFKYFPKTVGILGIGEDGHTAGIPAILPVTRRILDDQSSLVTYFDNSMYDISIYRTARKYGPRITMTFTALSQLDLIVLLVLGQKKREVLNSMFTRSTRFARSGQEGREEIEKMPAKFYLKPEIAEKVILITDQII